jgi:hypothetical protein
MPTIWSLIEQLQFVSLDLAVLLLFLTAGTIVLVRDWRLSLLALLVQYLVAGLILSRVVRPEIAVAKVLAGLLICPILYLSARQAGWSEIVGARFQARRLFSWRRTLGWEVFPAGHIFRFLAVLLMILTATTLGRTYTLAGSQPPFATAVYWLILAGLLLLILTEEPLKAGQGMLTALTGFELVFTTLERSLLLMALWGAVNLLIALAIGYLTVVRGVQEEAE